MDVYSKNARDYSDIPARSIFDSFWLRADGTVMARFYEAEPPYQDTFSSPALKIVSGIYLRHRGKHVHGPYAREDLAMSAAMDLRLIRQATEEGGDWKRVGSGKRV